MGASLSRWGRRDCIYPRAVQQGLSLLPPDPRRSRTGGCSRGSPWRFRPAGRRRSGRAAGDGAREQGLPARPHVWAPAPARVEAPSLPGRRKPTVRRGVSSPSARPPLPAHWLLESEQQEGCPLATRMWPHPRSKPRLPTPPGLRTAPPRVGVGRLRGVWKPLCAVCWFRMHSANVACVPTVGRHCARG